MEVWSLGRLIGEISSVGGIRIWVVICRHKVGQDAPPTGNGFLIGSFSYLRISILRVAE